ncbi:E3 ubiquitin-protein ligase RNF168-like [Salvia splendens]|uniref:E3 ubiquitin-protein ligase RNF168-like n=1 Tax=Salvia splendens TaxID=180675 RepID=UPI001C280856|nr:E3 ubiquitin-protein ligase RNF168-like [Salvia splendens]
MVAEANSSRSPGISGNPSKKRQEIAENGQKEESLFSPGFRSVAAMAGWDEEALLVASLIVEDNPDPQFKQKKRTDLQSLKTPQTNSRRLYLHVLLSYAFKFDETAIAEVEKHIKADEEVDAKSSDVSSSTPLIPCLDRLREELSCAICLEICYEPSTTPCGHSFCKKCLSSAADRCGRKCPKCRQIISTGKYSKVNTVLWNTVQLLFPQEVEARKAADESATEALEQPSQSRTRSQHTRQSRGVVELRSLESSNNSAERRRNREQRIRNRAQSSRGDVARTELPGQDRDAALALRLQREEFMEAFTGPDDRRRGSLAPATARANLRAMASRAINIRMSRGRRD